MLGDLVAIYDAGRREPLPLPVQDVLRLGGGPALSGEDPERAAKFRWKSSDRYPGEDQDRHSARVGPAGLAVGADGAAAAR